MNNTDPLCRVCDKPAVICAGHYPVCREHFDLYMEEGAKYLAVRPVWDAIQEGRALPAAEPTNQP